VAIELVRTLVGSLGLIAAVPLTTVLAALLAPAAPRRVPVDEPPPYVPPPGPLRPEPEPEPGRGERLRRSGADRFGDSPWGGSGRHDRPG
jgi:hypothetical protein